MNIINANKPEYERKKNLNKESENIYRGNSLLAEELEQLRAQLEREKNDAIAILS